MSAKVVPLFTRAFADRSIGVLSDVMRLEAKDVYSALSSAPNGLTAVEAATRLAHYGPNRIGEEKQLTLLDEIWARARNPLNALLFALSFASVFFSELWSLRAERLEQLVRNLGGSHWDVWRHAVLPQIWGLILICFVQSALYSWLDYGIVSIVGGGSVSSVTTRLFGYIREASVNQAAQSSLILLAPALLGFVITSSVYFLRPGGNSDRGAL